MAINSYLFNAVLQMQPYEYFLTPIMDDKAQVAIIALMLLALMDVLFGVCNAWFVQHDFSSHELRAGLIRKLGIPEVVFANGGTFCEVVTIGFTTKTVTSTVVGNNAITQVRTWQYT